MMGFTTPCYKKLTFEVYSVRARAQALSRACLLALAMLALFFSATSAVAQPAPSVGHLGIERDQDGVYVDASLDFALPTLVEDALQQGIALTFITEASVVRQRWYWTDRTESQVKRYSRLSYQPLTRRWRLGVSSLPFDESGLGISTGQTYDQLSDVLAAMQRVSHWKVASASELKAGQAYVLNFRFQLDISQLPRPLQIGALGRSDWSLSMSRNEPVPALDGP